MIKIILFSLVVSIQSFANLPANPSTPSPDEGSPATIWEGRASWDQALLESIREHKANLDTAQDIEGACPGYRQVSKALQETCWMRLISALITYENGRYDPKATYPDTPLTSVGLMMLSRGECPNAMTEQALTNPIENIKCGVRLLGKYIKKGNCLHCGGKNRGKGGGTYWSVLRPPYGPTKKNGEKKYGKKYEIIARTKNYRDFGPQGPEVLVAEARVETTVAPVPQLSQYSYRSQPTETEQPEFTEVKATPVEPDNFNVQLVDPVPYSESAVDSSGAPPISVLESF